MSKFLITGGAGFIGGNFCHYMVSKYPQDEFVCLDALTYAGNLETLEPIMNAGNFRFVHENICHREGIFKLFAEEHFDYVINFAAESHVDRSIENPEIFLKTNILGPQVLMDACLKYPVKRFHQVSTDEVYGDLPLDRPDLLFTEQTPLHTSSPYSASKAAADLLVMAYHDFKMFQQLRTLSISGKTDSHDHQKSTGRRTSSDLRERNQRSRLVACIRSLYGNRFNRTSGTRR